METAIIVGLLVGIPALAVWSFVSRSSFAEDLASYKDEAFGMVGLNKSDEVARHARWGTMPLRMHRTRRRLDAATGDIYQRERERRQAR